MHAAVMSTPCMWPEHALLWHSCAAGSNSVTNNKHTYNEQQLCRAPNASTPLSCLCRKGPSGRLRIGVMQGGRAAARSAPLKGGVVHIKFPLPDGLPIEGSGQAIAIARVLAQAGVGVDDGGGRAGGRRGVVSGQGDPRLGSIGGIRCCVSRQATLQARHLRVHAYIIVACAPQQVPKSQSAA